MRNGHKMQDYVKPDERVPATAPETLEQKAARARRWLARRGRLAVASNPRHRMPDGEYKQVGPVVPNAAGRPVSAL